MRISKLNILVAPQTTLKYSRGIICMYIILLYRCVAYTQECILIYLHIYYKYSTQSFK